MFYHAFIHSLFHTSGVRTVYLILSLETDAQILHDIPLIFAEIVPFLGNSINLNHEDITKIMKAFFGLQT